MILTEPPLDGTEAETLIGSLERQRRTFIWKAGGLDRAGLGATAPAGTMTLGGLIKHLALVEDMYFSIRLGREPAALWRGVDWDAEPDWAWRSAADDSPAELYALWHDCAARSRTNLAAALERDGLDQPAGDTGPDGRAPRLRRVLIDVIEEYARHTGHADLLREAVDGLTGEDPPI
ncbi:DUF664 domain-containing protein [Actinoplanes utahensis]|uniref:Mini-circle protein n=1 Tax=Actinoplanes utahensis TaxID=1869 RepID=A0A0A6UBM4_ACTUT|nr:DUF664 domain-containing protein [Actinoplanes utahensis]KHD73440.1 mini-circle protein [Actinoplanes utahensis]